MATAAGRSRTVSSSAARIESASSVDDPLVPPSRKPKPSSKTANALTSVARGEDLTTCWRRTYEAMTPTYGEWVIYEHCMPFNVARAFDEATGIDHPKIWTAKKDAEMWHALQATV